MLLIKMVILILSEQKYTGASASGDVMKQRWFAVLLEGGDPCACGTFLLISPSAVDHVWTEGAEMLPTMPFIVDSFCIPWFSEMPINFDLVPGIWGCYREMI